MRRAATSVAYIFVLWLVFALDTDAAQAQWQWRGGIETSGNVELNALQCDYRLMLWNHKKVSAEAREGEYSSTVTPRNITIDHAIFRIASAPYRESIMTSFTGVEGDFSDATVEHRFELSTMARELLGEIIVEDAREEYRAEILGKIATNATCHISYFTGFASGVTAICAFTDSEGKARNFVARVEEGKALLQERCE